MKLLFGISTILALLISAATIGCSDRGAMEPAGPDTTHHGPIVRKPNIYLYPTSRQQVTVRVSFPSGGSMLQSEPDYGSAWLVDVEPNGKINNRYDYLFYEAQTPDRYQRVSGWTVQRDTLAQFFRRILAQAGFIESEIRDFIEYWSPRLNSSEFYVISPQQMEQLEPLIRLDVTPSPKTQLRLFFVVHQTSHPGLNLRSPVLARTERKGFVLAEWGVVVE